MESRQVTKSEYYGQIHTDGALGKPGLRRGAKATRGEIQKKKKRKRVSGRYLTRKLKNLLKWRSFSRGLLKSFAR